MVIGHLVNFLQKIVESLSQRNSFALRFGGFLITALVFTLALLCGRYIEQILIFQGTLPDLIRYLILVISLGSCLAAKSLRQHVFNVINTLKIEANNHSLQRARQELGYIVGRDVENLTEQEILRATAETASENAVDGVFAPLFWMFVGLGLWEISHSIPGPLSLAFAYKASSTMDSMLGYREGNLKWLGTASARLDDILTFIPCRLVVITLPLVSRNWIKLPSLIKAAFKDGSKDLSPNSGLSEAIFAHCAKVQMGGLNIYNRKIIHKPILSGDSPEANTNSIKYILKITLRLELVWILSFSTILIVH